jgi:hypothetical protein
MSEKKTKTKIFIWPLILRSIFVLSVFVLLASFLIHSATALNGDLGRHLASGKIIWQTKHVPQTNLFSYTEPASPFTNYQWLSELIFYGLYSAAGLRGLIFFAVSIILLSFGLVFWTAWRKDYFILSALAAVLSVGLLVAQTDIGPQIFGLFCLAAFLAVLVKNREKIGRTLWLLVPLQLFWMNVDNTFYFGWFFFTFFFLDRLWARRKQIYLAAKNKKIDKFIALVVLAGILFGLVSLVSPAGWRAIFYPALAFENYGGIGLENQSPFVPENLAHAGLSVAFFEAVLTLLALSFLLNIKRLNFFYFLMTVFLAALSFKAIRFFPYLGLISLPILMQNFVQFRQNSTGFFAWWERFRLRGLARLLTIGAIFVILIWSVYWVVSNKFYLKYELPARFGWSASSNAEAAVGFLREQKIGGPLFNNAAAGDYLIWRLYPSEKVFVDSRQQAYSDDFWRSVYLPILSDAEAWHKYADAYKVNAVFFVLADVTTEAKKFPELMAKNTDWPLVYLDSRTAIWVRAIKNNQNLISEYSLTEPRLNQLVGRYLSGNNISDLTDLADFLAASGFAKQAEALYESVWSAYPKSKKIAFSLGQFFTGQNDNEKAVDYYKKAIELDKKFVEAYLALGQLYYRQEKFSEARQSWEMILRIDSKNETAKFYLDNMGLVPFKK